ncbi:MAG: hypothetical protein IIZ93_16740 [Acidaminococcaceae bacterium]|nr:hypothetical protein [Acidaminococcaceae bacterium]
MVRLTVERTFQDNKMYVEGFCTSQDTKPTSGIVTGSKMTEVDTGDVYLFEEGDSPTWHKVAAGWIDPNP